MLVAGKRIHGFIIWFSCVLARVLLPTFYILAGTALSFHCILHLGSITSAVCSCTVHGTLHHYRVADLDSTC